MATSLYNWWPRNVSVRVHKAANREWHLMCFEDEALVYEEHSKPLFGIGVWTLRHVNQHSHEGADGEGNPANYRTNDKKSIIDGRQLKTHREETGATPTPWSQFPPFRR